MVFALSEHGAKRWANFDACQLASTKEALRDRATRTVQRGQLLKAFELTFVVTSNESDTVVRLVAANENGAATIQHHTCDFAKVLLFDGRGVEQRTIWRPGLQLVPSGNDARTVPFNFTCKNLRVAPGLGCAGHTVFPDHQSTQLCIYISQVPRNCVKCRFG